ncbi:MAG: SAM-dependent methyltransferase, partial [Gimesia chilikensis]
EIREYLEGEGCRHWRATAEALVLFPYVTGGVSKRFATFLWPWRTTLTERTTFSGNMSDAGRDWWEYQQFTEFPYRAPLSITFGEIATHNHFVLDRGGKVFNQTAPVVKLPTKSTESDYLELLGLLNSSTACFWLKQVCFPKGGDHVGTEGARVTKV